jgi:hypothetical protein
MKSTMFKKLLLLTCISLNYLSARDFEKETGIRQGPFTKIRDLDFQDEQVIYGNFVMNLKKAYELYLQGNKAWIEYFDTAVELLKQINNDKTTECRALALEAAKHYNFEQLWTARHSLSGVLQRNSQKIIGTIPQILLSIQAAGKIKRMLDLKYAFSQETLFVAQGEGFFIPFKEIPFGQRRVTVQSMENDTNQTDITAYHPDHAATQEYRTLRIGRLQLGFPNTLNDLVRVTTPFLAQHFNINKLEKETLPQTAFLLATALTLYYNWGNDKEVINPGLTLGLNISTLVTTALKIAPIINSMRQELHNPCPLALIMRKLKQDQEKEAQEEEEEEKDDRNSASTKPPTSITPEYTARMVNGELHVERKQSE